MLLENFKIDPLDLPDIEDISFEKLERDYLWMRLIGWGFFFVITLGVLMIVNFISDAPTWIFFGPFGFLLVLIFYIEIRGFSIKGYAIRQKDVSYKSGLIWFSMTFVPLNRIQHCEVNQGPLGRLFDLASVRIYTAGSSSSDLSIRGLKKDEAHRLREYITQLSDDYE